MSTKRTALLSKIEALESTSAEALDGFSPSGSLRRMSNGSDSSVGSVISSEELPALLRDKLDLNKAKVARRLSSSRRLSVLSLGQSFFPEKLHERFKIRDLLGSGAYAQVWRIIDRETEQEYAMKVIFKNRAFSQKRLDQEVEALKRAKHPSIICLHEISSDDQHLYLRQDLAKGGCLFDWLIDSGGFTEERIAVIMKQLFEAVAYLHTNCLVHRDIKLENILVGEKEDENTVKLSDFGVAALLREDDKDKERTSVWRGTRFRPVMVSHVGSVAYMAPEFFKGVPYDQGVDLWACGVLMYMLLTLRAPFGNEDNDEKDQVEQIRRINAAEYHFLFKIWSTRSEESKDLINHLLKLDPRERVTAAEALQHPWFQKFAPSK